MLSHVADFLSARGKKFFRARAPSSSLILTMQRYDILIAVHEYLPNFFKKKHAVTMVRVKMVMIVFAMLYMLTNRIIKIILFLLFY